MFYTLKADVCHNVGTLLSPEKILDLVNKLGLANSEENEDNLDITIMQRTKTLCTSLENFVDKMLQKYDLFPDILIPFLVGVEQVCALNIFCF